MASNEEFVVRDIEVQLGCTLAEQHKGNTLARSVYRIPGKWLNHVESTSGREADKREADKKSILRAIIDPPQQLMQLMHFMDPEVVFRRSPVNR